MIFKHQLDVDITRACNLSCTECGRLVPAFKGINNYEADPVNIFNDLSNLAKVVRFNEAQLMGGEPLLHSNILECIKAVRNSNISNNIFITTNGILIDRITDEIINSVNGIIVSIYSNKLDLNKLSEFETKVFSMGRVLNRRYQTAFSPTFSQKEIENIDLSHCWQFSSCYNYSTEGYLYLCGSACAINRFTGDFNADGVSLRDDFNIDDVINHITVKKEYKACKNCYISANRGRSVFWSECTRDEWYKEHFNNE